MQPGGRYSSLHRLSSWLTLAKTVIIFSCLHVCTSLYVSVCELLTAGLLVVVRSGRSRSLACGSEIDAYKAGDRLGSSCTLPSDDTSARCLWLVALLSCDLFSPSGAAGILQKPFPRDISLCVVRRDGDGDAALSGPDSSSASRRLLFVLSLSLFISLSVSLF